MKNIKVIISMVLTLAAFLGSCACHASSIDIGFVVYPDKQASNQLKQTLGSLNTQNYWLPRSFVMDDTDATLQDLLMNIRKSLAAAKALKGQNLTVTRIEEGIFSSRTIYDIASTIQEDLLKTLHSEGLIGGNQSSYQDFYKLTVYVK